jgi:hypothetical protein
MSILLKKTSNGNIQIGEDIYPNGDIAANYDDSKEQLTLLSKIRNGIASQGSFELYLDENNAAYASYAALKIGVDSLIKYTSISSGLTDNGESISTAMTPEGHPEIAIHEPLLPFGSVHVENLTPIFQSDGVYGINDGQQITFASGSGSVGSTESMLEVSTGTTIYSQGVILGRKRLRYRAGQGVIARFTAMFTAPQPLSYQIAGVGHSEDGIYVGYADVLGNTPDFGILYVNRSKREVRTLTVSTGATSSSNLTITLNGVAFTVPVTNSGNIQRTVYEISTFAGYTGWDAYPSGSTVVFVRKAAGATAGAYSFAAGSTGVAAVIAQTRAGATGTETFIPKSTWNGDKLDGTGASGVTLDPTKLNIYEFQIGYLGTADIELRMKLSNIGSNNSTWAKVHTIKLIGTLTKSSFGNPSFPFTMAAYSAGSTTNLVVKTASYAGFIEGYKMLQGNRFTYYNQLTSVGAVNIQSIFTVLNARMYKSVVSQVVVNLLSITASTKHTSPVVIYIIKNGVLAGNPNFQSVSPISATLWDIAATTVTYSTGEQLIWSGQMGDTGQIDHHFGNGIFNAEEVTLQPGEWITVGAKATTGTPSYVTASINTREDQ